MINALNWTLDSWSMGIKSISVTCYHHFILGDSKMMLSKKYNKYPDGN